VGYAGLCAWARQFNERERERSESILRAPVVKTKWMGPHKIKQGSEEKEGSDGLG
jgi:hypothetical protein